jgi:hypothetical protein
MKALVKQSTSLDTPVFQAIYETVQGGFVLDETVLALGTTVKQGTVIGFDEATRKAKIAKYAVNLNASSANDTTYEVAKGHNLAIGMSVKVAGGSAQAISGINTTNPAFDVITVGTTLSASAVAAGAAIFVDDDGFNKAGGLLFDEVDVAVGADITVLNRGTVYERRIAPVPAVIKALIPNIIFSQSF